VFIFEGAKRIYFPAPPKWIKARYSDDDVFEPPKFADWIRDSRKSQNHAFLHQMKPAQNPPFGRYYISNYYIKTLLWNDGSASKKCGCVRSDNISSCHVEAAVQRILDWFPCYFLFHKGTVLISRECKSIGCMTLHKSVPWVLQKWSCDGEEHLVQPSGASHHKRPGRAVTRWAAVDEFIASTSKTRIKAIRKELPDLIASVEHENRFDSFLWEHLLQTLQNKERL